MNKLFAWELKEFQLVETNNPVFVGVSQNVPSLPNVSDLSKLGYSLPVDIPVLNPDDILQNANAIPVDALHEKIAAQEAQLNQLNQAVSEANIKIDAAQEILTNYGIPQEVVSNLVQQKKEAGLSELGSNL